MRFSSAQLMMLRAVLEFEIAERSPQPVAPGAVAFERSLAAAMASADAGILEAAQEIRLLLDEGRFDEEIAPEDGEVLANILFRGGLGLHMLAKDLRAQGRLRPEQLEVLRAELEFEITELASGDAVTLAAVKKALRLLDEGKFADEIDPEARDGIAHFLVRGGARLNLLGKELLRQERSAA